MIEGLYLDVKGSEIIDLMKQRIGHHEAKVALYEKNLADLKKLNATLQEDADAAEMSKVSNAAGPTRSLETSIESHRDKACYFKFAVKHVVPEETYRLDDRALVLLGVMPERMRY